MVTMGDGRWVEVGDDVFARRYQELDLTVGLVIGADACLVIDTRGDAGQGAELAAAVREVTPHPWTIVLTHAHFDHSFGTSAFGRCEVWAQRGCRADLAKNGTETRQTWAQRYREQNQTTIADAIAGTGIVLPERLVTDSAELAIGGRSVVLTHFGPAHTGHDLVVHVPDADVIFAGDLVEHGPSFTTGSFGSDTVLPGWPSVLAEILALRPRVIVPGHGDPVGPEFVATQRETLAILIGLRARIDAGELAEDDALARSPLPADITRAAFSRS